MGELGEIADLKIIPRVSGFFVAIFWRSRYYNIAKLDLEHSTTPYVDLRYAPPSALVEERGIDAVPLVATQVIKLSPVYLCEPVDVTDLKLDSVRARADSVYIKDILFLKLTKEGFVVNTGVHKTKYAEISSMRE